MKLRAVSLSLVFVVFFSAPVFAGPAEHAADDEFLATVARLAPVKPLKVRAQVISATDRKKYGTFGPVITWPHIPVSAANLPDGRIVTFASNRRMSFPSGPEFTYAATFNPTTGQIVEVNHNNHDMFCGHLVMLEDGRPFIMGGRNTVKHTSVFNWQLNRWERKASMNDGRWYPTATHLAGNRVMVASGSGGTNTVEVGSPEGGFHRLSNINWSGIAGASGFESHWWPLNFLAPNGWVFHAGPTDRMHWVNPNGNGQLVDSGKNVPGSWYPKHSAVAMFAKGKLVIAGGAASTGGGTTRNVYTVDLNGAQPVVTQVAAMKHKRRFPNGIMLPDGRMFVVGGNTSGAKFSDSGTVFETEIYNPATNTWSVGADIAIPRNYHSVALLLPDGRVYAGGGGLSGTGPANHPDAQIYKPGYFYNTNGSNAARPTITTAPTDVRAGQTFSVAASSTVQRFTMTRMTATTHGLSTDMRFLNVQHTKTGATSYDLTMETNPNVLTDGFWMLWALDGNGVPSVSKTVQVTRGAKPTITAVGNQSNVAGVPVSLPIVATDTDGDALTFAATNLPTGLGINATTGVISGTPTTAQTKNVTVTVDDQVEGTATRNFTWTIAPMPNNPPVLTAPANRNEPLGSPVNLTLTASDADNNPLTWSATGLPNGVVLNTRTGKLTGSLNVAGTFNVGLTVSDGTATDTGSFVWNVRDELVILPVTGSPAASGAGVNFNFGPNGGGRNYSVNWGDGSAIQTSGNGTFSHSYSQPGRYDVSVTVTDDAGQSATTTFTQTVHGALTAHAPRVSQSIIYTANDRVWNVNPDNDSVTVTNAITLQKINEVSVSFNPRSLAEAPGNKIWVTAKRSDAIRVIRGSNFTTEATILMPRGSTPHGIVINPTGDTAYVALEGTGEVAVIDVASKTIVSRVDVGPDPRHLSINHDGTKVYLSRFISPTVSGESTANPNPGTTQGGEVVVLAKSGATLTVSKTIILQNSTRADAADASRGIPNYLGPVAISPDNSQGWLASKQDNIQRGQGRDGQLLNHDRTVRSISSRIDLAAETETQSERIDHDNAGVAVSSIFGPTGNFVYVALEGSRDVAVIDAFGGAEINRFQTGRAPQGLAISPDGNTLFVHNFMSRNVTAHDVTEIVDGTGDQVPKLATITAVANEKMAANVLLGKQHFYDAEDVRLALQEYMSCASCHSDGGHDGRVWDLTQFGEGLRNTIDLRGKSGHGFLHWTANFDEVHDFEGQIRVLSGGQGFLTDAQFAATQDPFGASKVGLSPDLDALAAYVNSLTDTGLSPHRKANGDLTTTAIAGKVIFEQEQCATCHSGENFTDSDGVTRHDIGTGLPADTPTLRSLWNSAPYLHDGRAATLAAAISAHDTVVNMSSEDTAALTEYLLQIDSDEPAPLDPGNGGGTQAGPNLFTNGGFENNLTGWDTWNPVTIVGGAASGAKAARLGFSLAVQAFPITSSTEYELFGKAKTSGDTWRGFGVTFYDLNGNQVHDDDSAEFASGAAYQDFALTMTTPANAKIASVWFWCSDGGTLTIDDLVMRTPGEEPDPDPVGPTANLFTATTAVSGPFSVEARFSENVTGITASDFVVTNGTASGLSSTSAQNYFVNITPTAAGQVTILLPAAAGKSAANADSQASNQLLVSFQDTPPPAGQPESDTLTLTTGQTRNVTFLGTFNSPVVFTTIEAAATAPPLVARIHNVTSAGYQLTLQRLDGSTAAVPDVKVHTFILEEGIYTVGTDGAKMEVGKIDLDETSSAWNGFTFGSEITPQQTYSNPVVIGQLQTSFSDHWAQFWSRGAVVGEPFKSGETKLTLGHHTGEDPDTWVEFVETAGYLIIESGRGTLKGIPFEAGVSPKTGTVATDDTFEVTASGTMPAVAKTLLSIEGNQNDEGGLPIVRSATISKITIKIDEDKLADDERNHGREAVGWLLLGQ